MTMRQPAPVPVLVPLDPPANAGPDQPGAVALATFLDGIAGLLRAGLPKRLWLEATVADVRASAAGWTLELADARGSKAVATLRVFLPAGTLAAVRRDLGVALDPALLAGMTTCLLVAPSFGPRWHLGGRVEAFARALAPSLQGG